MARGWLFKVEVTGFPRTARTDPIEVYGGHIERWAVLADDPDQAGELISAKVYSKNRIDRELRPDEVSDLRLTPGVPAHVDGW